MPEKDQAEPGINTGDATSTESVQPTRSGQGGSPPPATPVARGKRRLFASLIVLMSLGVVALGVYLFRSQLLYNGRYIGILMALGAMACGGLLVRHAVRIFVEEDKFDEQQLDAEQAAASEPNLAGQETNPDTPPPAAGQKFK